MGCKIDDNKEMKPLGLVMTGTLELLIELGLKQSLSYILPFFDS